MAGTADAPPVAPISGDEHRRQLRRAVVAAAIGTTIEWYDFFLYGTVTGLVFAPLFFPHSDPLVGTLQAFGVYAVGFASRPIGAAIFGHYGDRVGRKAALIATLVLMGAATFLVALVPTYQRIGIWGGVLLTLLRFLQGIGVGGEWGGSVLLSMEWARSNRHRGFIASWPQFGVPAGLFLSNLAVLACSAWSGDHFLTWGWRIPFLFSIVLIGVGLYVRTGILETPVFASLATAGRLEQAPVSEVLRRHPREIALTALCRMAEQGPFTLFSAFVYVYGTDTLHVPRNFLLAAVLTASAASFVFIPLFGHLSDLLGRKRVYMAGAVLTGILRIRVLQAARHPGAGYRVCRYRAVADTARHAVRSASRADCRSFPARLRYSGASLGYQLSSLIAGGPAPLIAAWLLGRYHSGTAIAAYILACSVVTLISTAFLDDYTNKDIKAE